uniref:Uncharacterized protein n=1 Tax=Eutreptiella gymnastica TaxID=73025 RepID=A0A7S4CCQ6_9EUGL
MEVELLEPLPEPSDDDDDVLDPVRDLWLSDARPRQPRPEPAPALQQTTWDQKVDVFALDEAVPYDRYAVAEWMTWDAGARFESEDWEMRSEKEWEWNLTEPAPKPKKKRRFEVKWTKIDEKDEM